MFFCNDTATTEIYTLSLHDALPILVRALWQPHPGGAAGRVPVGYALRQLQAAGGAPLAPGSRSAPVGRGSDAEQGREDRKSTRLNSSHANIPYAVFCLKKKTKLRSL